MADAELNVQLRLLQDQVQADAQKAATTAQKVFAASPHMALKDKASVEAEQKRNRELLSQSSLSGTTIAARRAGKAAGEAFGKGLADGAATGGGIKTAVEKAAAKSAKDAVTFKKDMSFLMMPLFNPGSMWATLFSGRQTYSAMNTESGAKFRGKFMGGMGPGAATGLLVAGATAAGLVLKALTKTIKETIAAYEHARQLYAKSLMSGLGLNFTVKRGMLASIMGVSEEDAIKFGAALNYLNPKIEWAASVLAKTATPLAGVSMESKVLSENLRAVWSTIAEALAPAIKAFLINLNNFIVTIGKSDVLRVAASIFGVILQYIVDVVGGVQLIISTFVTGMKLIAGSVALVIATLINLLAKIPGAGKLGIHSMDTVAITSSMGDSAGALAHQYRDFANNIFGAKTKDTPAPISFMKQLPASAWEKAGLIIGGKGNTTNDLIRQGNKHLATIAAAVSGGGGVARSFGMSPAIANP